MGARGSAQLQIGVIDIYLELPTFIYVLREVVFVLLFGEGQRRLTAVGRVVNGYTPAACYLQR
eukprot:COSAG02_NODE_22340_length_755_cov_2.484756_1_plen_62_part_10